MTRDTCKDCKFWLNIDQSQGDTDYAKLGQCRRHAPSSTPADTRNNWPKTYDDAWCGEWRWFHDDGTQ